MKFNPAKHQRRSIRLKNYNYSQPGWYFVTICTYQNSMFFGDIEDGRMMFDEAGNITYKYWKNIPNHFLHVQLDDFIIMPNHIHGIIVINEVGAKNFSPLHEIVNNKFQSPSKTIGSIIRGFKIGVTKWFRNNTDIYKVWQRNYYEHIIRDEIDLNRIRKYIIENPLKWHDDTYFK